MLGLDQQVYEPEEQRKSEQKNKECSQNEFNWIIIITGTLSILGIFFFFLQQLLLD